MNANKMPTNAANVSPSPGGEGRGERGQTREAYLFIAESGETWIQAKPPEAHDWSGWRYSRMQIYKLEINPEAKPHEACVKVFEPRGDDQWTAVKQLFR